MSLSIQEKYSELKEELNGKDPFVKYALLKEELDNKDPLKRYAQIKEELDYIKKENVRKFEEDKKNREENTLEAMESLFHSLGGEESNIENQPIIADEQPQELISEEEIVNVEKVDVQKERPINGLESVVNAISKQEARKEKLQEQPNDSVSVRIEKLEKWIRKIAVAGAGSGEVRLLNLDDVDTTDLGNNKIIKYNSTTGKFVFGTAGSGHTIQNAGSDLTSRTNLNFDGTYVIATDDSGNDQTDITLHAALLGSTSATGTTLADADRVVVNDAGTMKQVALTDFETYFETSLDTLSNVTSLGTLSTLTVDNIIINGTNIGHTSDTDAIAIASSGNVTISQDLAVSGALTVSGGTTKVESTVTTIVDPIIHLQTASGGGALGSDTNKDVGLALQYHTGSAAKTAFLGYDDSAGKLTFIPDASLSSEVVSGTVGAIVANLEGTVTGDVTGNADTATALATGRTIGMTGDVVWTSASFTGSGNVTGSATIQAGSVENSMLADDAVGADELASDAVVNASVASGAAIALSKLATTTVSRALVSSGTGVISASDITTTELNRLDGIGSTVVGLTDSQTLTNKTLTSPVLNTGISGTAVLDEDNMTSDSATQLATQQSIKAYTDATSTAMAIALG